MRWRKNPIVPTKTTQKNQPLMAGYSSVKHGEIYLYCRAIII
nr:MAG TPA_asm: hypothetical protein [Caudoviricetes sp.]